MDVACALHDTLGQILEALDHSVDADKVNPGVEEACNLSVVPEYVVTRISSPVVRTQPEHRDLREPHTHIVAV